MICILSTWMSEQTEEGERKKQVEERERVNWIFSKFGSQNRPKKVSKNVEVYSPRRSPGVCGRNKGHPVAKGSRSGVAKVWAVKQISL